MGAQNHKAITEPGAFAPGSLFLYPAKKRRKIGALLRWRFRKNLIL
nr:MAG TPA: hypothetical protein [Caudoviricetes sp.]